MSRQALGKGLEALIPVTGDIDNLSTTHKATTELFIETITANPFQPRKEFKPHELEELAASIREKGVVQPIMVRSLANGQYQLVAGERRLRASKLAGLAKIPVIIREMDDAECLEIALIENIQRSDLNAYEEARAFEQLMQQFNLTQEEVAKKVGKDRSSVANTIRLLKLPESVLQKIQTSRISEGHARALLGISDESMVERLADKIVREGLSVRETERLAQGLKPVKAATNRNAKKSAIQDPHTRHLEEELRRKLGTQVKVLPKDTQKGKIEIEYYSLEDLDRILALLG